MKKSEKFFFLLLSALFLQACNGLTRSSSIKFKSKDVLFSSQTADADFVWNINSSNDFISQNDSSKLTKWIDQAQQHISLYPIVIPGTYYPDIDHSPALVDTSNGKRVYFYPNSQLTTLKEDSYSLASNEYSLLLEIRELEFPNNLDSSNTVNLLQLQPLDNNLEADILSVDAIQEGDNIKFIASQSHSELDYVRNSILIPKGEISTGVGLAVRWSKSTNEISIAVNGNKTTSKVEQSGTITPLSFSTRQLSLHTNNFDNNGAFKLAELGLFKKALSDIELTEYSLGLMRTYELNLKTAISTLSTSDIQAGDISTTAKILSIFNKTEGSYACTSCHYELSSLSGLMSAESNGKKWITPNSSSDSLLIQALRHEPNVSPMPKWGGSLPQEDINFIADWIDKGALE